MKSVMRKKVSLMHRLVLGTVLAFCMTSSWADEREELLQEAIERIDELEDIVQELTESVGSRAVVHAFDGIKLDIGGFLHTAHTTAEGEDRTTSSFNRQNFELLISAELSERWSAFFAGGFLRESNDPFVVGSRTEPEFDTNSRNPLIIGWVNYLHSDAFQIRIGRMITPHSIINIEHFPATLLDPEQPQFLRPFGGSTIFPNFSTGIQVHGKRYQENGNTWTYSVYFTEPTNNIEDYVYGARLNYDFARYFSFAVNVASGERPIPGPITESDYDLAGIEFKIDSPRWLVKSEAYTTDEDDGGDRSAWYVQPAFKINPKWLVFYRYDDLDAGDVQGESTENVIGVNYLPTRNIRLRAIYTRKEFDSNSFTGEPSADADIYQLSGTFSF